MINFDGNVTLKESNRRGAMPSAGMINAIARLLNGMRGENGITVRQDWCGMVISGSDSGLAVGSAWRLGRVNQTTRAATIGAGWLIHGTRAHIQVAQANVVVSGGTLAAPSWVVLEYTPATNLAVILPITWSVRPQSTPTVWRTVLHGFYESSGRIRHEGQHHFGDVQVNMWP